jgi:hypothetical protein
MSKKKQCAKKSCKKSCSKKSCGSKSQAQKKCGGTLPETKETIIEVKKGTKAGDFLRMIKKALGYE